MQIAVRTLNIYLFKANNSCDRYQGPGQFLVNAVISGLESQLLVHCVSEESDRLTFYFPGVLSGLEKRIYCYDGMRRQFIIIKMKGTESGSTQRMDRVEIEYSPGTHCADCSISY